MKQLIAILLLLIFSVDIFAEEVSVTTPDGTVVIYKGNLVTTSQTSAFYSLYDGISQCRLYIKLADGLLSEGLNELQTSVEVVPGQDIVFPRIQLPPTTGNQHNLVMQCLGPDQDGIRQVTFSTELVYFDILPNVVTNLELELYLTKLTVRSVIDSTYLVPGESYQIETLANKVIPITLEAEDTAFTLTYDIGDQPKLISESDGSDLGNAVYDPSFGNVYNEDLSLDVYDGGINISAAFIRGDAILSSPGLLVDNIPDRSESLVYNFDVRGLEAGSYNVVLTVDGLEVEYNLNVSIAERSPVPAQTGRIDSHTIVEYGEIMSLEIDLVTLYEDIDNGTYNDPEVRLFLIKGGDI